MRGFFQPAGFYRERCRAFVTSAEGMLRGNPANRTRIGCGRLAAGNARSAFGARWYNDVFWAARMRPRPVRCYPLHLQQQPRWLNGAVRWDRPCCRPDHQRKPLLAAPWGGCRMACQAASQSGRQQLHPQAQRSTELRIDPTRLPARQHCQAD